MVSNYFKASFLGRTGIGCKNHSAPGETGPEQYFFLKRVNHLLEQRHHIIVHSSFPCSSQPAYIQAFAIQFG